MLIDTHCHLDFPDFDTDRDEVIQRAKSNGVDYIVNIGSSLKGSQGAAGLAQQYDSVYAAVGLHPHEADNFTPDIYAALCGLANNKKIVAIGETGLDYFKNYSEAANQRRLFECLIKLAKELNLPLVIHNRQAEADVLAILRKFMPLRAVVHCFSGDENFLRQCLDLGFLVSFTCNVTYRKAQKTRALVKLAPLERLMLETDAPFLAPEGLRGRRNEPAQVKLLAEEIARIRGIDFAEVAQITTANAKNFFNIG